MADWNFREYGEAQGIVTIDHALGKEELIVTIHNKDTNIEVSIHENEDEERKGSFRLTSAMAQELFDWLKSEGVVS